MRKKKSPKPIASPSYRMFVATCWDELQKRINAFADAREADSWKGGGDPQDIPLIEARLQVATLELDEHIRAMRRIFDPEK